MIEHLRALGRQSVAGAPKAAATQEDANRIAEARAPEHPTTKTILPATSSEHQDQDQQHSTGYDRRGPTTQKPRGDYGTI